MKTKIGFYILLVLFRLPLVGQTSIIDSFRLSPNQPLIIDDIRFLVYYNDVPGSMEPEASIQFKNDSILIESTINSAVGCCLESYIDTIEIGKLPQGEYILKHELNDWGKVGYLGTDTVLSFTVSVVNLIPLNNSNNILFYPNPTRDKVIFSMNSAINSDITVKVFNMCGQEITSFNFSVSDQNIIIDLKNNPNGLYFVMLKNQEIQYCQKIIRD
jgi:hypothetical protein